MRKRDELSKEHTCMQHAHPDEMVFVLLGRDPAAPLAIRAWAAERIRLGKNLETDAQIIEALENAKTMEEEGTRWKTLQENAEYQAARQLDYRTSYRLAGLWQNLHLVDTSAPTFEQLKNKLQEAFAAQDPDLLKTMGPAFVEQWCETELKLWKDAVAIIKANPW